MNVRGRVLPYLVGLAFTPSVLLAQPTGVATLTSPTGTISSTAPTFAWTSVTGATQYRLYIARGGAVKSDAVYSAASVGCDGGGTCSLASPIVLANGLHGWWIRAGNGLGEGPWSTEGLFTVSVTSSAPTGAAVLQAPSGAISGTTPIFRWTEVANASEYNVWVNGPSNIVQNPVINALYPSAVCTAGVCSVSSPAVLPNGGHQWWVRARNAAGDGPWSPPVSFTLNATSSSPTLGWPWDTIDDQTPDFTWTGVTGATDYRLWVNGPGGTNLINTVYPSSICTGAGGLHCVQTSAVTLGNGSHSWWVRPIASGLEGSWSPEGKFTVSTTAAPPTGAATLITPLGLQVTNTPTFTWTAVTAATGYLVWVNGPGANYQWTPTAVAAGCDGGGTCSLVAPVTLGSGSHQWWVQAKNAAGDGPWSPSLTFTTP